MKLDESEHPERESEPESKNPQAAEREHPLSSQVSPSKCALPSVTMATLSLPQDDHTHTREHSVSVYANST